MSFPSLDDPFRRVAEHPPLLAVSQPRAYRVNVGSRGPAQERRLRSTQTGRLLRCRTDDLDRLHDVRDDLVVAHAGGSLAQRGGAFYAWATAAGRMKAPKTHRSGKKIPKKNIHP